MITLAMAVANFRAEAKITIVDNCDVSPDLLITKTLGNSNVIAYLNKYSQSYLEGVYNRNSWLLTS